METGCGDRRSRGVDHGYIGPLALGTGPSRPESSSAACPCGRCSTTAASSIRPAYDSCILAARQQETTRHVSVGTAFHPRTSLLNRKMQWREWSGYFASSVYADFHDIEYNAIREAVALIDVSPLYKYLVSGPDATRLVDRVITRSTRRVASGPLTRYLYSGETSIRAAASRITLYSMSWKSAYTLEAK